MPSLTPLSLLEDRTCEWRAWAHGARLLQVRQRVLPGLDQVSRGGGEAESFGERRPQKNPVWRGKKKQRGQFLSSSRDWTRHSDEYLKRDSASRWIVTPNIGWLVKYMLFQFLGVMQIFERLVSCCSNLLKTALERKVNRLVSTLTRLGHATGYVATGQTRAGSRSNQQRAQPKHRRSLQFLRHVRLHVAIRHCVVTHLAAKFWFFGSFFPAYATLGRKLHKRLRIWHEGESCRWELIGMLPDEVLKRAEPITKSCQVDNLFPFLDSVTEIFYPILYIFPFNFMLGRIP